MNAAKCASGLREFADWIEEHGDSNDIYLYPGQMSMFVECPDKEVFQRVARMLERGAKRELGGNLHLDRSFGMVKVSAYTARENVCRKVVVGTSEVTREVRDPEMLEQVPLVTVTETVEEVEWVCGPIFAGDREEVSA